MYPQPLNELDKETSEMMRKRFCLSSLFLRSIHFTQHILLIYVPLEGGLLLPGNTHCMKIASPVLSLNTFSQAVRLSSPHNLETWILSLIYYTQTACVSHPSLSLTFIKWPASISVEFAIPLISMNDGSLPSQNKGGSKGRVM